MRTNFNKLLMEKYFEFGNSTSRGKLREINEDYMGYFDTPNGHLFLVCDGLGGYNAGDLASRMAVEKIHFYLKENYFENIKEALKSAIQYSDKEIWNFVKEKKEFVGTGTTVVAVLFRENEIAYSHVGDSRLYLFSDNKFKQLTKDHSVVEQLIFDGVITKEEARNHPQKNIITQALGKGEIVLKVSQTTFSFGDLFLLCSDGLNSMLTDYEIENILKKEIHIQEKAIELVETANEKGGLDNVTVQLIRNTKNIEKMNYKNKNNKLFLLILLLPIVFGFLSFCRNKKVFQPEEAKNPAFFKQVKKTNYSYILVNYKVKADENIEKIIERFNIGRLYLTRHNYFIPKSICKNQIFKIPVKALYQIKTGDTWEGISKKYSIKAENIKKANPNKERLEEGELLYVPIH